MIGQERGITAPDVGAQGRLGVAACDSPAEEAAEEQAEAMEDQADAMEDAGEITDEQADAMEAEADNIEDAAEGDTDEYTEGLEEAVN